MNWVLFRVDRSSSVIGPSCVSTHTSLASPTAVIILLYVNNDHASHGLRSPGEKTAITARPKIQSQSQILMYGRSIFCLPHRPNFSDIFDFCLHWVSVVRDASDIIELSDFRRDTLRLSICTVNSIIKTKPAIFDCKYCFCWIQNYTSQVL
jgi:hypothetical protein